MVKLSESGFLRELLYKRSSLSALISVCAFFCCLASYGNGENQEGQLLLPGSGLSGSARQPIAQGTHEGRSASAYTVQGKPVTKQQYEAVKLQDEGLLLMRSNANEQALQKFRQSIEMFDGYAEVHHSLALAYAKLGNNQEAIKELKRATELNPNLDESWLLLAGIYQSAGNLQESLNAYNEYLRRFPANPLVAKVNVSLGLLYAKLGKSEEAINELKHSIELNPNMPASWITLGGVYQAKGDLINAIDTYSSFKERFPNDTMIPKIKGLLDALTKEKHRQDAEAGVNHWQQEEQQRVQEQGSSSGTSKPLNHEAASASAGRDDYLASMIEKNGLARWPRSRIPISVYISDGARVNGYREAFKIILKRSFEDWAKAAGGAVSFTLVDSASSARLKCFWTDKASELKNPSEAGDARLFEDQNYINNAEIWFLTQPLSKSMPLTDNVFRLIALHEIGHALGLNGHTSNPEDIMFYSTTFKDSWRELSGRDSRSITKLYQSDI